MSMAPSLLDRLLNYQRLIETLNSEKLQLENSLENYKSMYEISSNTTKETVESTRQTIAILSDRLKTKEEELVRVEQVKSELERKSKEMQASLGKVANALRSSEKQLIEERDGKRYLELQLRLKAGTVEHDESDIAGDSKSSTINMLGLTDLRRYCKDVHRELREVLHQKKKIEGFNEALERDLRAERAASAKLASKAVEARRRIMEDSGREWHLNLTMNTLKENEKRLEDEISVLKTELSIYRTDAAMCHALIDDKKQLEEMVLLEREGFFLYLLISHLITLTHSHTRPYT